MGRDDLSYGSNETEKHHEEVVAEEEKHHAVATVKQVDAGAELSLGVRGEIDPKEALRIRSALNGICFIQACSNT